MGKKFKPRLGFDSPRIGTGMVLAMDRLALIAAALAKRNFSANLTLRIERLLDGRDDRARLFCCNSGCFVCTRELQAIVDEVELAEKSPPQ